MTTNMHWLKAPFAVVVIALMAAPAMAQTELLSNGDVETPSPADWTLTGCGWIDLSTSGWFGFNVGDAHSPDHIVGKAVNSGSSNEFGQMEQSVGTPFGSGASYDLTLRFWARSHAAGGNPTPDTITGKIIVDGSTVASVSASTADVGFLYDTWTQYTATWAGIANTDITVRVEMAGDATGGTWVIWGVDDVSLEDSHISGTPVVSGIDPQLIYDNTGDVTGATITGSDLDGATAVKLVGASGTITATAFTPEVDGLSITGVDFPTTGEAPGKYDVVVEKTGFDSGILAGGFLIRDPNNLLLNGDFESGDLSYWNTWNGWNTIGSSVYDVNTASSVHGLTPVVYGGTYSLSLIHNGLGAEGGVYQIVPVQPGETLRFSCAWGGGNLAKAPFAAGRGVLHYIGVRQFGIPNASAFDSGNELDNLVMIDGLEGGQFGWWDMSTPDPDTASFVVQVPAGVNEVTVSMTLWHYLDGSETTMGTDIMVSRFDDMVLEVIPACPNQHSVDPVGAPQIAGVNDQVVVNVTGSDLDLVTGVSLFQGGAAYPATSFNSAGGGTSLTATFDPPVYNPGTGAPGGWPIATYELRTEQSSCPTVTTADVVEVQCQDATVLTSVDVPTLTKPQGIVTMLVSGTDVDLLDALSLVYTPEPRDPPGDRAPYWVPISEAVGTKLAVTDADNVTYQFDLTNAQAGSYKLEGYRYDQCHYDGFYDTDGDFVSEHVYLPIEAANVLTLELPIGVNLVANPGFEDTVNVEWVVEAEVGNTTKGDPMPGPDIAFTEYIGPGDPSNTGYPYIPLLDTEGVTGDEVHFAHGGNYVGGCYSFNTSSGSGGLNYAVWRTPNRGWIRQSVGLPNGPGNYSLVLAFWVRLWDEAHPSATLYARIVADGELVSEMPIAFPEYGMASQDGWDPYTKLSVEWVGNAQTDITVEFYFDTESPGGPGSTATVAFVIDDVELISGDEPCGMPFADVDGDLDIDQDDFSIFQSCYTGNVPSDLSGACRCLDVDLDSDVDQADYDDFEACATGPDIKLDPDDPGTWPVGCEQ